MPLFKRAAPRLPFVSCVVAAAGSSTRMGEDKITADLLGQPVILRTLRALEDSPYIREIILVTRRESLTTLAGLCHKNGLTKVSAVILGGDSRTHSVQLGVLQCSPKASFIAIHDGARPLVSPALIARVVEQAVKTGAAAPALAMKDTIKTVDEREIVRSTADRAALRAVQTPQVFDADLIRAALQRALEQHAAITDDCSAVEALGHPVELVAGEEENLKLTTPFDRLVAEAILRQRGEREETHMRIGHGYDVHKLVAGRKLILGGVEIPHETGLLGHSDADVLSHAIMDALLGAAALGDIGQHFPDSDDAYAGADSLKLMGEVGKILAREGYAVGNLDATILAQAPKLAPHIPQMRQNIAAALGVDTALVSVKATTEEHLGFTGAKEGMAAHAVALLVRK